MVRRGNESILSVKSKKLDLITKASEFDEYILVKKPGVSILRHAKLFYANRSYLNFQSKKLSVKRAYVHSLRPMPADSTDDGQTTAIRRDNYREAKLRVQEELGGARQKRILAERKKEKQVFDHGASLDASQETNAPLPKIVKRLGGKRH